MEENNLIINEKIEDIDIVYKEKQEENKNIVNSENKETKTLNKNMNPFFKVLSIIILIIIIWMWIFWVTCWWILLLMGFDWFMGAWMFPRTVIIDNIIVRILWIILICLIIWYWFKKIIEIALNKKTFWQVFSKSFLLFIFLIIGGLIYLSIL